MELRPEFRKESNSPYHVIRRYIMIPSRRSFIKSSAALAGATASTLLGQDRGQRSANADSLVEVVNPQNRVPVSLIIDDSTALVNMAHYGIPQFAEIFPDKYKQNWKSLPREIPDSFVRTFGEWCHENGVKGKYSMVPYPACVGWLDRRLPGWSYQELQESLELVRTLMLPDWDIHPEMISHTFVINTKTGRPYEERSEYFMENWRWTDGKSVDQLADYMSYALTILKNVGLPCEGITTPGGFGNRVLPELSQATLESCRHVFGAEIPHYFRHLYTDDTSVAPRVEYASGLDGDDPRCVVSIIGCTGDWFGGWDGLTPGDVEMFISEDGKKGRLPQVIGREEPAIMVCHWPGIYFNGQEIGFKIFKEIVARLAANYDHLVWMKLSEISRYWAAKELTAISRSGRGLDFSAPFATPFFTVKTKLEGSKNPVFVHKEKRARLERVENILQLQAGKWWQGDGEAFFCFDLPKGKSTLLLG